MQMPIVTHLSIPKKALWIDFGLRLPSRGNSLITDSCTQWCCSLCLCSEKEESSLYYFLKKKILDACQERTHTLPGRPFTGGAGFISYSCFWHILLIRQLLTQCAGSHLEVHTSWKSYRKPGQKL